MIRLLISFPHHPRGGQFRFHVSLELSQVQALDVFGLATCPSASCMPYSVVSCVSL